MGGIPDSLKRNAIDDLTQKSTTPIRTELSKMTSVASLLPTDFKNIHQTVNRRRRKTIPNLHQSHADVHVLDG